MKIVIVMNATGNPPGKVADAELHFTDGLLAGTKLIGFSLWTRRNGDGLSVTFPARQYSVNGERRSFALLRPAKEANATTPIAEAIKAAYLEQRSLLDAAIATNAGSVSVPFGL